MMKIKILGCSKILLMCFWASLLLMTNMIYAQAVLQTPEQKVASFPVTQWVSKSVGDMVTIENGTGANLHIMINVNDDGSSDPAGVSVQNCGDTKHIDAGSSAVCITSSIDNPVTFSSDKTSPASGTYQVMQKLPPN